MDVIIFPQFIYAYLSATGIQRVYCEGKITKLAFTEILFLHH